MNKADRHKRGVLKWIIREYNAICRICHNRTKKDGCKTKGLNIGFDEPCPIALMIYRAEYNLKKARY